MHYMLLKSYLWLTDRLTNQQTDMVILRAPSSMELKIYTKNENITENQKFIEIYWIIENLSKNRNKPKPVS